MAEFNGMNGDIILNARDIPVGRVPGESYGYQSSLLVTVDIRVERLRRQESYQTTTHDAVSAPLDFALTSSVWNTTRSDIVAGGATVEPLRSLSSVSRYFNRDDVAHLVDWFDRYHLNGMRAGCVHQTPTGDTTGERLDNTPACPETGYRYGHAWLVEILPDGFLTDLTTALSAAIEDRRVYIHPDYVGA